MSKFSSYKESQLLFENWRKHVNEGLGGLEEAYPMRPSGRRFPSRMRPATGSRPNPTRNAGNPTRHPEGRKIVGRLAPFRDSQNLLSSMIRDFVDSGGRINTWKIMSLEDVVGTVGHPKEDPFVDRYQSEDEANSKRLLRKYAIGPLKKLVKDLDKIDVDVNAIDLIGIEGEGPEIGFVISQILQTIGYPEETAAPVEEEGDVPPKELDEQSQLPPEASKILNQLKAMKTREPEAFTMAMGALQSMGEGV